LLDDAQRELAFAGEPMSDRQLAQADLGDTAAPYMNLSVALFNKGRVDEALEALKRAASLEPNNSNVRNNLGALYLSKNNYEEAVRELNAALKTNPTNAEAHNNLGTAYLRKGRPDLAYPQYSEALRLKPDYTEARANLKLAEQANAAQPKR
jgi:protein O-mannosyl-transferase